MKSLQKLLPSPIGPLHLVASEKGLRGIYWSKQEGVPSAPFAGAPAKHLSCAARQLKQYFEGRRTRFDVPLDLEGTAFQKSVWKALSLIPYGRTCSYKDIARRIRNGSAVRAVGTANGKNPICIIIPCHRVIAHDGTIGGYAGGLKIKKTLLALERR